MSDNTVDARNQRLDFRQDDVIRMKDARLTEDQFETEMGRTGFHYQSPCLMQGTMGDDGVLEASRLLNPDMARMLGMLEAKLNYLIGMNVMRQVELPDLEERPVNISITGMRFASGREYKAGDRVKLTLSLPFFPPVVVDLLARVVYVNPHGKGRSQVGVSFIYRSEEEEEVITHYIFKRHREAIRMKYRQRLRYSRLGNEELT